MEEDKMDGILKGYFSNRRHVPEKGENCPPAETLGSYVSGGLEPSELYGVGSHVKSCGLCSELIEGALLYSAYGKQIKLQEVPIKLKNKAKSLHPAYKTKDRKKKDSFKSNIWIALSLASLGASFFFPDYFLQFLILAVILGFKWVFDRGSTHALIMVYNAWKKHDKSSDRELDEIFRNRL